MKPYLFVVCLLAVLAFNNPSTCCAQNTARTKIVEQQKMPFDADEQQLKSLIVKLENILTCKETFEDLDYLFMTDAETLSYLQEVGQANAEHAVPFFMQLQKQLKEQLKPHFSQTSKIDLVFHKQRYGESEKMKVIAIGINIYDKQQNPQSMRIQLIDYKGEYRLFSAQS